MSANRRALFRDYIARFNPTRDPTYALEAGFYVPSPLATSSRIANRLEIEPTSTHLVVGGVGSGKTTELLWVRRHLSETSDVRPIFIDVPAKQKLSVLREGVLVALAADHIVAEMQAPDGTLPPAHQEVGRLIRNLTNGYWEDQYGDPGDEGEYTRVPGILTPRVDDEVDQLTEAVKSLISAAPISYVFLFDGLDRVRRSEKFEKMVLRDVRLLQRVGIGAVIVGPQELRFDLQRRIVDEFTAFHLHGAADIEDIEGQSFLDRLLTERAAVEVLPEETRRRLVHLSGGLVRDLVSLARNAGEIAYGDGSDQVKPGHVDSAADRFGRTLLLGISGTMQKRLLELRPSPYPVKTGRRGTVEFTAGSEADVELLLHRVLIEVPGAHVRYILHPTVMPLLAGLRKSA